MFLKNVRPQHASSANKYLLFEFMRLDNVWGKCTLWLVPLCLVFEYLRRCQYGKREDRNPHFKCQRLYSKMWPGVLVNVTFMKFRVLFKTGAAAYFKPGGPEKKGSLSLRHASLCAVHFTFFSSRVHGRNYKPKSNHALAKLITHKTGY
jgi:hypothetical protein